MKCDAEELGLESVGERVQATTACGRPETGKLQVEQRVCDRSPSGYGVTWTKELGGGDAAN